MAENKDKGSPNAPAEKTPAPNEEDAGEYTSLKDAGSTKQSAGDAGETPLLKSSDSEGSTSGSESAIGALYARIARLSKQSKEEEDAGGAEVKGNGKPPSPERTKPRPPDPSTKPKVSWIHGTAGQPEKGQAPAVPKEKKRSSLEALGRSEKEAQRAKEKSSKHKEHRHQESKNTEAGSVSPSKHKAQKPRPGQEQMEHINGAVQNALRKIGNFHADKKPADPKDAPKSPGKSRSDVVHPHINSEAATLLAAQLKEKTQSINRNEGVVKQNGLSTPQAHREKPTPPQKAKRSATVPHQPAAKPLLPTSSNLQKMVAPVAETASLEVKTPEKQDSNGPRAADLGEPTPKKTPIKKPPRKKGKEGTLDAETKSTPKTAIMPPQVVK